LEEGQTVETVVLELTAWREFPARNEGLFERRPVQCSALTVRVKRRLRG